MFRGIFTFPVHPKPKKGMHGLFSIANYIETQGLCPSVHNFHPFRLIALEILFYDVTSGHESEQGAWLGSNSLLSRLPLPLTAHL
jgi:hypothetical protein